MTDNYHISGSRKAGYSVKREGASRASLRTTTKAAAERAAKRYAGNYGGGEVRIHAPDGKIVDSDTVPHGNDPCPPRDTVM